LNQAKLVLGGGFLLIYVAVSMVLFAQEVMENPDEGITAWASYGDAFYQIDAEIGALNIPASEAIMVNDSPSNFVFTNRPSLAIPNGDETVLRDAMQRYGVAYFVLQENHPVGLKSMWSERNSNLFNLLYSGEDFAIWQLKADQ
jgi:hypothetical protein